MSWSRFLLWGALIGTTTTLLNGQGLPSTSISLFKFEPASTEVLSEPKYLTGFNPTGYNNQPTFFGPDILYITSDWEANGQTDLLKLNLKSESILKVTDTPDSEYSPTRTPDNQGISCISVPPDQTENPIQWLWKYPLDRTNSGNAVSYDFENVGYHHWINSSQVAIFLVGDPHQLIIYNTSNGEVTNVDENIGRCFRMNDQGRLVYVHKAAHNIWYLKTYDVTTGTKNIIGETKTGSEDFEILDDGKMIMGQGSKLFILGDIGGWTELVDLNKYNVKKISRLAIQNNKIAIVHAS
jgi:hypothetical protein